MALEPELEVIPTKTKLKRIFPEDETTATRVDRFNAGMSISQIAEEDGVQFITVYGYLAKKKALPKNYLAKEFEAALIRLKVTLPDQVEYKFLQEESEELQNLFLTPVTKKPRQFRSDYAYPDRKLAIEVDGGTHMPSGGAHALDRDKRNAYTICGWRVLFFDLGLLSNPDRCANLVKIALKLIPRKKQFKVKKKVELEKLWHLEKD